MAEGNVNQEAIEMAREVRAQNENLRNSLNNSINQCETLLELLNLSEENPDTKLSKFARGMFEQPIEGPLSSQELKTFLMEDAYGKTLDEVEGILRQKYQNNIPAVKQQLRKVKDKITAHHSNLGINLDHNLMIRINKYVSDLPDD